MKRSWNPSVWAGFVLGVVGVMSFPLFFARFPITRDFPWVNLILLALALLLVALGVVRAFRRPDLYRGKISGSILGILTVLLTGFFLVETLYVSRLLPASHGAPKVGQMAPDFTLPDSQNNPVTLSALVNSPFVPNGAPTGTASLGQTAAVLLIFYRGYW